MKKVLTFTPPHFKLTFSLVLIMFFSLLFQQVLIAQCPEFEVGRKLVSTDGCEFTFELDIKDIDAAYDDPFYSIRFEWKYDIIGDAVFKSKGFVNPSVLMAIAGVDLDLENDNKTLVITQTSTMAASETLGRQIEFVIEAEPNSCFTLKKNNGATFYNNIGGDGFCGSADVSIADTTICDAGYPISGTITAGASIYTSCNNTNDLGVQGANVTITSADDTTCSDISDSYGDYSCNLCDDDGNEICVTTTCDNPCGLSDYDLVLMHNYLIGATSWTPEYWIMGDANYNGETTTIDKILFQRQLLGTDTTSILNWCRFVPVEDLDNAPTPNSTNKAAYLAMDNCITQGSGISQDFVRIMLGDFDGSCSDCIHSDDLGSIPLVVDNTIGNETSVSFDLKDELYTLTLHFNIPDGTEILDLQSNIRNLEYVINETEIHLIWSDAESIDDAYKIIPNQKLFTITFSGDSSPILAEEGSYVNLRNNHINHLHANVRNQGEELTRSILISKYTSMKVQGSQNEAKFQLFDLNGRKLFSRNVNFALGFISINENLPSGIYIMRLYNDDNQISKKIFID